MSRILIMQGRLVPPEANRFQSFPREHWREEFFLAAESGLDGIEWIYDEFGEDVNPIATDDGIREMKDRSRKTGVGVFSVCADYFMDRPIVTAQGSDLVGIVNRLLWLLERCRLAGIERMVLPFVDQSRIITEEDEARIIDVLADILPVAEEHSVEVHLETSLAPVPFVRLLDRVPHHLVKVNYDSGNSSSLGYDPAEEFAAYGGRIGSVHIKDRVRGGGTVPLGTGDANLQMVFEELAKIGYCGDYVLQVARSAPNEEVQWAKQNRTYVERELRYVPRTHARSGP